MSLNETPNVAAPGRRVVKGTQRLRRSLLLGTAICWACAVARGVTKTVETLKGPIEVDDIHRLVELDSRRRIKPYEMLRSERGEYPSERVVFRDSATGTELWKMSRNPGYNYHTYSNL